MDIKTQNEQENKLVLPSVIRIQKTIIQARDNAVVDTDALNVEKPYCNAIN